MHGTLGHRELIYYFELFSQAIINAERPNRGYKKLKTHEENPNSQESLLQSRERVPRKPRRRVKKSKTHGNNFDDPDPDPDTPSVEVRELQPEGLFGKLWAHIKAPFKMGYI